MCRSRKLGGTTELRVLRVNLILFFFFMWICLCLFSIMGAFSLYILPLNSHFLGISSWEAEKSSVAKALTRQIWIPKFVYPETHLSVSPCKFSILIIEISPGSHRTASRTKLESCKFCEKFCLK